MPSFCRHNRFIQNCPICREPEAPRKRGGSTSSSATRARSTGSTSRSTGRGGGAVRVRQLTRAADDGYASPLVPGLRATVVAERLADEIGFAAGRLAELEASPPGLYAEAGSAPVPEEGIWLAVQTVLLGPAEDADDPFAALREVVVPWAGGELPDLTGFAFGPRSPFRDAAAARRGLAGYRSWAQRQGSQAAGLEGDPGWTPERRFDRLYERLGTLPGFGRARYDLLVVLGRLGLVDARATSLHTGSSDDTTVAAKRVFGIGDPLLLDRRAGDLAEAAEVPVESLDLALANVARLPGTPRMRLGASPDADDPAARERAAAALGV